MNQEEYLSRLGAGLKGRIPDPERDEILADYREHFRMGIMDDRTEESIALALGDPEDLAREWCAVSLVRTAETHSSFRNMGRAILATIGLGLFNIIVVLIPAVILLVMLIILFLIGLAHAAGGFILAILSFAEITGIHDTTEILLPSAGICIGIGVCALGLLIIIADGYCARWIYRLAIRYLKWNISVIRGRDKA